MGQAISKTVAIAEIIKVFSPTSVSDIFQLCYQEDFLKYLSLLILIQRRVPRLHQDTTINSVSITDVWEPIEEGLLP